MQEKSKIKKEKWGKPKLIILVRGKPEERVVLACKVDTGFIIDGSGPNYFHEGCGAQSSMGQACGYCAVTATS